MTSPSSRSSTGTGIIMVLFVGAGAPMAYYVWHTLSNLLAGQVHGPSVAIATVLLLILIALLRVMARFLSDT